MPDRRVSSRVCFRVFVSLVRGLLSLQLKDAKISKLYLVLSMTARALSQFVYSQSRARKQVVSERQESKQSWVDRSLMGAARMDSPIKHFIPTLKLV